MKKIGLRLLTILLKALAMLPLGVLYIVADVAYFVLYYIVKYRREVVHRNLEKSFPEKSASERTRIERQFYHFLCNQMIETIKLLHLPDKEVRRRISFRNPELIQQYIDQGRNVYLMLSHYGNWEWATSMMLFFDVGEGFGGQIYKPLTNKWFDSLMLGLRERFGTTCIPMKKTLRVMSDLKAAGRTFVIGFIADQTPLRKDLHHWVRFLNQDTPVIDGVEKLARRSNDPVIYIDVHIPRRGYIEFEAELLSDAPAELAPYELLDKYMARLESAIRRAPAYWLWSHNRWKHSHLKPKDENE